ncbi:hypothetical protein CRENBAI_021264 [Crenichthys baileyi]|uniref:Uncharacterized protein n=1 Tax=Crenichthys baileyi TaxID=28760 RepID=A0AAV9RWP3_9TELE
MMACAPSSRTVAGLIAGHKACRASPSTKVKPSQSALHCPGPIPPSPETASPNRRIPCPEPVPRSNEIQAIPREPKAKHQRTTPDNPTHIPRPRLPAPDPRPPGPARTPARGRHPPGNPEPPRSSTATRPVIYVRWHRLPKRPPRATKAPVQLGPQPPVPDPLATPAQGHPNPFKPRTQRF